MNNYNFEKWKIIDNYNNKGELEVSDARLASEFNGIENTPNVLSFVRIATWTANR
jgi:hypothetical protein